MRRRLVDRTKKASTAGEGADSDLEGWTRLVAGPTGARLVNLLGGAGDFFVECVKQATDNNTLRCFAIAAPVPC